MKKTHGGTDMEGKNVSTSMNVAVFDDDEVIREVIAIILEGHFGFKVMAFDSNDRVEDQEVANIIQRGEVDVVICDGKTSGRQRLSGLAVVSIVRKLNPNTRIFVCTGKPSQEFLQQCKQLGADAFICKPFKIAEIEAALSVEGFYTNFKPYSIDSIFEVLPTTVSMIRDIITQLPDLTLADPTTATK